MKKAGPDRRKPVLIVQHAEHEHPAAVRRSLETQGVRTLWIHPYRGEAYPELSRISGMISLGGPMSANDDDVHPWIAAELELLRACAEAGMPTVGICLGGQLLARALGGRVETHSTVEVGWYPIQLNEAGRADPVAGAAGASPTVYQWHGDTFHLPPGARLLGGSAACDRQAYRWGELAYGFQFHPEADHQLVQEWLSVEGVPEEIRMIRKRFGARTVQSPSTQVERALRGERASLKITAAIGSLFRSERPATEPAVEFGQLEALATKRGGVQVEVTGSDGAPLTLRGRIATLLTIPAGTFLIFQEENTLLWPIRIEDVRSVKTRK
jgi:GMP synthase (glutamine-hydrolysing)